jgi:benzoylformate decarboxylase
MDLADPPVDFVALGTSMGVASTLVEKAADVGDAVRSAIEAGRPHLIELPIAAPA